jgi:hypothetical protein
MIPFAQLQLQINKVDLKLEEFMKSSEHCCHKFKWNYIEWSPYANVRIHRRWLLTRMQRYLEGKTKDPQNLICNCHNRGVKDPQRISMDELKAEFYVCKQNIELLMKNSLFFWLKFLKAIVKSAKAKGDTLRAAKVTGIIQKEAMQKQWRWINRSIGSSMLPRDFLQRCQTSG